MKLRYQVILIFIVILALFYPTISGELIAGDDDHLFAGLRRLDGWNLEELFLVRGTLLYYRPLTILTFRFDTIIWNLNTEIMHLENLLLHALCALLVFCLTRKLLDKMVRQASLLPLAAGMLFAVHPLTVESTSWISGRTDLVAGVLVLLSALFILRFRENRSPVELVLGFLFFAMAPFGKETAVAFLPGALCLLFAKSERSSDTISSAQRKNQLAALWISLWAIVAFAVFFAVRFLAHGNHSGRIATTIKFIFNDLWYSTFVCLRGIGFYFKKLFIPWPLNFAIIEVDPLYELLGIPVVLFVLFLLFRRRLAGAFVVAGAFLVTPSFLLMFHQIAWTPYAERYLYIPLAFFLPPFLVWFARQLRHLSPVVPKTVFIAIFVVLAGSSFQRASVWATNYALWKDTKEKSPRSLPSGNDYALTLVRLERYDEAIKEFRRIVNLQSGFEYNPQYTLNLSVALMEVERFAESRDAMVEVLEKNRGKTEKAKEYLEELYQTWGLKLKDEQERKQLELELAAILEKYQDKSEKD